MAAGTACQPLGLHTLGCEVRAVQVSGRKVPVMAYRVSQGRHSAGSGSAGGTHPSGKDSSADRRGKLKDRAAPAFPNPVRLRRVSGRQREAASTAYRASQGRRFSGPRLPLPLSSLA